MWVLISRLLSVTSISNLSAIAARISTLIGRAVPANAGGILKVVKSLVKSKSLHASVAISVLMEYLPDFGFTDVDGELDLISGANAVLKEILARREQVTLLSTGDGDPDTIFGVDSGEVEKIQVGLKAALVTYELAYRAIGSHSALAAVMAAARLEPAVLKMCRDSMTES